MRMTMTLTLATLLMAGTAQANDVFGTYQTQKNDDGKYLHVEVHACESDAAKVCGTIREAHGGADPTVVGKAIIWDMMAEDATEWDDGKIWKADDDEVYDSEMELNGTTLKVSGCVLGGLVCRSQDWAKVN